MTLWFSAKQARNDNRQLYLADCVGWMWSSKLCACAESLMSNRWRPCLHSSRHNCLKPHERAFLLSLRTVSWLSLLCAADLNAGWSNRHVAATSMNRESSRSHAVFTVSIESKDNTDLPECCAQYQCFLKAVWATETVSQIFPTVSQNTVEPLCITTT